MTDTKAEHLLSCAYAYKNADICNNEIPDKFKSIDETLECMMHVLWHEAKADYKEPITAPENPIHHPIDLHLSLIHI